MLVVPDVHGRLFWKSALEAYPNEEVIFLGDYLDPYPHENIYPEDAIKIFREILDLDQSRVTLLLGNHDLMYINPYHKKNSCRHDWENDEEISKLFLDNLDKFKLIEERGNLIFSHAGLHQTWIKNHPEFGKDIINYLNEHLFEDSVMKALGEFSYHRGASHLISGSPVWSDVREWIRSKDIYDEYEEDNGKIQIFGHTQLRDGVIIDEFPNFKCIDCKHVCRIINDKIEVL